VPDFRFSFTFRLAFGHDSPDRQMRSHGGRSVAGDGRSGRREEKMRVRGAMRVPRAMQGSGEGE